MMVERFSAEWWQREFEDACDRANKMEAERDALLQAAAVPWVVIQSVYSCFDDPTPAVDVFGPFDTADAAFAWIEQRGHEDGVGYRVDCVTAPPV